MKINGSKTYLVAAGVIMLAVGGFLTGDLSLNEAITQGMAGLGLGALRHGVGKAGAK